MLEYAARVADKKLKGIHFDEEGKQTFASARPIPSSAINHAASTRCGEAVSDGRSHD